MNSSNKEKYNEFCKSVYVPIYSKIWWMDAICGEENWDVWLYEENNAILASMPYFIEKRGDYTYITKAALTQNNGIIFNYSDGMRDISKQAFEEKVINKACEFINYLNVDVYEQQFHYNFKNWLPFYWNQFTEMTRYTYVIEDTSNLEQTWNDISSKYRNKIRKGNKNIHLIKEIGEDEFYIEHEKIFKKQGLNCPFSIDLWQRLYYACKCHENCIILGACNEENSIMSVLFLVWDQESMYQLLGGSIPEYQNYDTYDALIWHGIKISNSKRLKYDFEGSVIKRISKSFREFGGSPKPYFRIRKIFNPDIIRKEAEESIVRLMKENT